MLQYLVRSTKTTRAAASWPARLLAWFDANQRPMPWRSRPAPYAVWVSEIMLQQTQVATVIPYFQRFMKRFPSVSRLAAADLQDVLKTWEGLGYYARARNLHRAAREVVGRFGGRLPRTAARLRDLPGIGPYTAAAIASICFGEPAPVVDGNVVRVFARFLGIGELSTRPRVRRRIRGRLARHIPAAGPGDFNQAVMELGATVCRPRAPACPVCPLAPDCVARKTRRTGVLPVRPRAAKIPEYEIAVGIVRRGNRVLIARRRADGMLGGLWEFPGGKQRRGESPAVAARREILEETGVKVRVGRRLAVVKHAYSHFRIRLHALDCFYLSGTARPLASDAVRWEPLARLGDYPFPAANRKILDLLLSAKHENM